MQCRKRSHESPGPQSCVRIGLRRKKAVIKSEPGPRSSIVVRVFHCVRFMAGAALLGLVAQMPAQAPAQAAGWLEKTIYMTGPRYDAVLPACEAALDTIASRFAQKEGRFWNSGAQILGFERVRQIAFSPWASGTIPRRFCTAKALVSDGRKHTVNFWIG